MTYYTIHLLLCNFRAYDLSGCGVLTKGDLEKITHRVCLNVSLKNNQPSQFFFKISKLYPNHAKAGQRVFFRAIFLDLLLIIFVRAFENVDFILTELSS